MNRRSLIGAIWSVTHPEYRSYGIEGGEPKMYRGNDLSLSHLDAIEEVALVELAIRKGVLLLDKKLSPARFTRMSNTMAAIVAYILGDDLSLDAKYSEITVDTDGFMVGKNRAPRCYELIGKVEDLDRNWAKLLTVAGLTQDELWAAGVLFRAKIKREAQTAEQSIQQ